MSKNDPLPDSQPRQIDAKIVIPLVGTGCALLAAVLSGCVLLFTNDKTTRIQTTLSQIQQGQFAAEQSAKSTQFNRESARQYVALVYGDLTSKDGSRQKAALSLLEILEPDVALKLLSWAQKTGVILPGNIDEGNAVKKTLESLQENGRFRIFLHVGQAKNRPVPDVDAIKKALATQGFAVLATDEDVDEFGPGVDYFDDRDIDAAKKVAASVGGLLPGNSDSMRVRRQTVQSRPGTLGIWF
jgi:hypothetical protein